MGILAALSYVTDLVGKIAGAHSNRPQLSVEILSFRPDRKGNRWVFRASVHNQGRVVADGCEGFWSLFNPQLKELSSGTSVFWAPQSDDDYDFKNRTCRTARLEYNERRFCWAEIELDTSSRGDRGLRFFGDDGSVGLYTFAIVIEYGQFKAFDFVVINVPHDIVSLSSDDEVWDFAPSRGAGGVRGVLHRSRVRKHISRIDYHNYVRPT